jgi:intracellular septation protein A
MISPGPQPQRLPRPDEHRDPQASTKGLVVDASRDAEPTAATKPEMAGWLRSITKIVIIDVAAPLIAYSLLRSAGISAVTALVLSGVFPALGVAIGAIRHRRLDVVGAVVLAGILVGTALGLISHSARLVLMEGSVPTALFGLACLGSLRMRRPLMYSFAAEFIGLDTARGRELISLWRYEGFRHVFRIITAVWGVGFLLEAALRVAIDYSTSTGTALALSKVMPYAWIGIFAAWTVAYGRYQENKNKGRRMTAVATASIDDPGTSDTDPQPADITNTADQA